MSRLVLLCKAQGDFKHSGKYYLQGGRWHAFKHDKPVPKGAPVAAHPHAAGKFVPKQHFSDAEWQQLKLPAENTNAGSFNKLLDQLKQHSDSGDVTAILGMQYGTNTYGKKGATIANHLLGQYGSEHKVMPGQKAGEHAAVSQAPAEPASAATVTDVTPAGYGIDEPAGPEHAPGSYPDVYGQIIKLNDAGDAAGLNKLADGLPNSGEMLALKKLAQQKAAKLVPAAEEGPKEGDTKPAADGGTLVLKDGHWTKQEGDKPKMGPVGQALKEAISKPAEDPMGSFASLKVDIDEAAAAGHINALKDIEAYLTKPQNKSEPGAAATLAYLNSKKERAATAKSPSAAAPAGLAMPEFAEGKTKAGIKAYYEKVGQQVLDMAAAGDVDGLAKLKHYGSKPNAKGKISNTWAGKTANSKTLIALHEQAMQHVGGDKPVTAEPEAPGISSSTPVPAKTKKILDDLAASGDKFSLTMMATSNEDVNPHIAAYANKLIAGIPDEPSPAEKVKQATQAATASVAQDPGFKEAVSIAQAATAGDTTSKVSQIPWDSQLLPDSNSNAKSHNGKVAQIKAMAETGDLAGLEAFKAGKNTYGQKQMKLAAVAIAALKESGPAMAAEPAPTSAAPAKPDVAFSVHWSEIADGIEQAIADGDAEKLKMHATSTEGFSSPGAVAINAYAKEGLKFVGGDTAPTLSPLAEQLQNTKNIMGKMAAAEQYVVKYGKSPETYQAIAAAYASIGGDEAAEHWKAKADALASPTIADLVGQAGNATDATKVALDHVAKNNTTPEAVQEAAAALKDHGYDSIADKFLQASAIAEQSVGPKEGDTKQGADGTLVFKNGRWHKQAEAAAAPADQHPLDAIEVPDLSDLNYPQKAATLLEYLKQKVKDEGPSALKGVTKKMSSTGKLITKLPTPDGGTYKITGYESLTSKSHNKVFEYVEALKAAAGAPKKAAPKAKAAAPVYASNGIQSMDGWKQTGPQGGSNPGGKFKDENGTEWYCKFPGDEDMAKSEVLAAQLYAIAGIAGQDAKLITKDGKLGIASKWTTVKKASPAQLASTEGVASGFGVDAWLGNWDVVGMQFDNLQVGDNGKAVRVDAGGSLTYRAQGGKKQFGTTVLEIDSLRDKAINPQAAAVFGNLTKADITASVAKVLAIPDSAIINAVEMYGPGDAANKKALADVLLARKADLAAKFPKAVKAPKKRLDPSHLPVNPDDLPKAHDFSNWLGTGKPLSSQPHVNAANASVEQELLASALAGNLTRLKDFKFHSIDKATGNATGQMHPIAQHPSKHVVQLHADLVQLLDEIANPPEPLKVFQETDVGTIEQLSASLPPKKFGTTVSAVSSNEKLGFWVVLGTAHGAQKFKPSKVMDYSTAAIAAGHEKYKQASKLAKHFINSVQASGSYNDLFRNGAKEDHQGNKLADVAQAALAHATSMPEGTSLYRWQNMPDEMVKKMLAAPDGSVFQATGPMCTSYHPTATSGFGQHRVTIRYAKGAKAVESFGSGGFKGEKEVTTLPNSRFIILSKQMVPNEKNPSKQRLELEVLMLPPDLGI